MIIETDMAPENAEAFEAMLTGNGIGFSKDPSGPGGGCPCYCIVCDTPDAAFRVVNFYFGTDR